MFKLSLQLSGFAGPVFSTFDTMFDLLAYVRTVKSLCSVDGWDIFYTGD